MLATIQETLTATDPPSISKDDPMPEAGRKILLTNLQQMLVHQNGLPTPESVHHVHQMRVMIRRMRSALRLFAPYYKKKALRPIVLGLRHTARMLGAVRDLDVLSDNLRQYAQKHNLAWEDILAFLAQERQQTFGLLMQWLESDEYAEFLGRYTRFVTTVGKGSISHSSATAIPFKVRHVVTVLLYQQLSHVLAYDELLPTDHAETLHELRIACKALRYSLNFFDDLLGNSAKLFHNDVKSLQDYLGLLNDAVVAHTRLSSDWLDETMRAKLAPYCEELLATQHTLIRGFLSRWRIFQTRKVQERLSEAVLVLR
jgi:CHAD domain-containing protein